MQVKSKVMDANDILRAVSRISYEIAEKNNINDVAVVGIHTRGVALGLRIVKKLKEISGVDVPFGVLDIVKFRDDRDNGKNAGDDRTAISFSLKGKSLVLVDDVLFTGRTVRAALNAVIALGRPAKISLAVLIDRGHRELPIKADFVGKNVPTASGDKVRVNLSETDNEDCVLVYGESL